MKNIVPPDARYEIRCPKLGHQISFSYCRVENQGLPCPKTIDCWHIHFRVRAYLKEELTLEEFNKAFVFRPKPKMMMLIDLIEQAKTAKEDNST